MLPTENFAPRDYAEEVRHARKRFTLRELSLLGLVVGLLIWWLL